jgi:hypothetical protein
MAPVEFYDSAPGVFPPGTQYAALYADGEFSQAGRFNNIPNRRWITVLGGDASADYAGIADFESGNPVFFDAGALGAWARGRKSRGFRFRTYCNRSDFHAAYQQVGTLGAEWWIATLDNNPHWTPAAIVASLKAISGIAVDPATIWGVQWGTNSRYDTSYLFGQW